MKTRGARVLALTGLFLLAFAAPAAAAIPGGISLSTNHIGRGGSITVRGDGFAPNSSVQVHNGHAIGSFGDAFGTQLHADANGVVTALVGRNVRAGTYRVRLTGLSPTGQLRSVSSVYTAQNTTCTGPDTPPGCTAPLPRTGGATPWILVGGLLVVGLGGRRVLRHHTSAIGATALVVVIGIALVGVDRAPAHASGFGQITGVLRANDGHTAGGVCVHAYNAHDFASDVTDAMGAFTLRNLPTGAYRVDAADCNATTTLLGHSFGSVSVTGANTARNATLERGAILVGRVHTATGVPVVAECIHVAAKAGFTRGCVAGSDANGLYVSEPLAAGHYRVAFQDLSGAHALQYLGGTASPRRATLAALQPGTVYSSDVSAQSAGTISGKVTDESTSNPLAGICVSLYNDGQPTMVSAASGSDGTYVLQGVAAGDHQVGFYDCNSDGHNYTLEFFDDEPDLASADTVTNDGATDTPNIDAALTPDTTTTTTAPTTSTTLVTSSSTSSTSTSTSTSTTATTAVVSTTTSTTASASAPAKQTPTGAATTSSTNVAPGGTTTVSGDGFKPGSDVAVVLYSTPVLLGHVSATSAGHVSMTVTIPSSFSGTHDIQLQGVDANNAPHVLAKTINVRALSRTGTGVTGIWPIGALLVISGGIGMFLGRRRMLGKHYLS